MNFLEKGYDKKRQQREKLSKKDGNRQLTTARRKGLVRTILLEDGKDDIAKLTGNGAKSGKMVFSSGTQGLIPEVELSTGFVTLMDYD